MRTEVNANITHLYVLHRNLSFISHFFTVQKTNASTLNLNISANSRARAKIQTSGDDKNP